MLRRCVLNLEMLLSRVCYSYSTPLSLSSSSLPPSFTQRNCVRTCAMYGGLISLRLRTTTTCANCFRICLRGGATRMMASLTGQGRKLLVHTHTHTHTHTLSLSLSLSLSLILWYDVASAVVPDPISVFCVHFHRKVQLVRSQSLQRDNQYMYVLIHIQYMCDSSLYHN